MLKFSSVVPLASVIYTEIRFAETIFLLHQAEEENNVENFVTGLNFASLLFATNHVTKYAFITTEFFKWWYLSSDVEKKIFEELIMTKKTIRW